MPFLHKPVKKSLLFVPEIPYLSTTGIFTGKREMFFIRQNGSIQHREACC
jgi:hypothetical protein